MTESNVVETRVRCGECTTRENGGVYHESAKDVARCYAMKYRKYTSKQEQAQFAALAKKRGWMAA